MSDYSIPRVSESQSNFGVSSSTSTSNPYADALLAELRKVFGLLSYSNQFLDGWKNGTIKIDSWEDFIKELNKAIPGSGKVSPNDSELQYAFMSFILDQLGITPPPRVAFQLDWHRSLSKYDLGPWNSLKDTILSQDPKATFFSFASGLFKSVFAEYAKKGFESKIDDLESRTESFLLDFKIFLKLGPALQDVKYANIDTYRKQYFSQFPNHTEEDFQAEFKKFYTKTVTEKGYFIPGFFNDNWQKDLQGTPGIGKKERADYRILYELLGTLSEMVDLLQEIAIRQATMPSKFYTPMLKAYTDLIAQVPILTDQMLKKYQPDDNKRVQLVSSLGGVLSTYTEKLRSYRNIMQDEAKQHNTSIEQTNQAVQQQINIYELPIQTLTNIFRAILRS